MINIVLCRVEGSVNIGSSCRALKSMGLTSLKIVAPAPIDKDEVKKWSLSAYNIFEEAGFFTSLADALKDSHLVAGTCRRHGKHRKTNYILPGEFAQLCGEYNKESNIDIVFGNEQSGLDDNELALCHQLITIPTSSNYPSLNLSHAVQIMGYELFKLQSYQAKRYNLINANQVEQLSHKAVASLDQLNFFAIGGPTARNEALMFWHDILGRAALRGNEEQYLSRFFDKIAHINPGHYD